MDYERRVVPLSVKVDGGIRFGSGFVIKINEEMFLATAAHMGDYDLSPRNDWSLWKEKIHLMRPTGLGNPTGIGETEGEIDLFRTNAFGQKVPNFRYYNREEREGRIADIILIPLQNDSEILRNFDCFLLPEDEAYPTIAGEVIMLGRRDPFPTLSVTKHQITQSAGPVHVMKPASEVGDSGGPVLDLEDRLVGMNFGSPTNNPYEAILFSTEAIKSVADSKNGVSLSFPNFKKST